MLQSQISSIYECNTNNIVLSRNFNVIAHSVKLVSKTLSNITGCLCNAILSTYVRRSDTVAIFLNGRDE